MTTQTTTGFQSMKEEVEQKQKNLMELARLKGIYDPTVLREQLLLARSRLFREYAVKLISMKSGSQTPGVDKEIYEKEEESSFDNLVEYLKIQISKPNRYRAMPVKRV